MVPYQNKDYACFTMGKNETDDYDINTEINIFSFYCYYLKALPKILYMESMIKCSFI